MKLNFKWITGFVLAFIVAVLLIGPLDTAAAVDKWSADPATVTASDFCDEPDDTAWYQAQHRGGFIGSVVACSGWAAIHKIAIMHDYASVSATALDGWVTGNRNQPWVTRLPRIGDYGG